MLDVDDRGVPIDPAALAAIHARAAFALSEVLREAAALGIDVMPVKGVLTARWLYRSVVERPLRDVDLRIRAGDLPLVTALAQRKRWPITARSRAYRAVTFVVEGVSFDVETHLGAPGMCSLSVDSALARGAYTERDFAAPHVRPRDADHALLLALNVWKDHVHRAAPWARRDLLRVASRVEPLALADLAWKGGCASMVWAVASWLAPEESAWASVRDALGDPPRKRWAIRAVTRLRSGAQTSHLQSRASADAPSMRLRALWSMGAYALESPRLE